MSLLIKYHLRTGHVVEHRSDEGTPQAVLDFHDEIFRDLSDDARLTLDSERGKRIIRVSAIDYIDIETVDGGG